MAGSNTNPDSTEISRLHDLLTRMNHEAAHHSTCTALTVVLSQTLEDEIAVTAQIHTSPAHTIGIVTISTEPHLVEVLSICEGHVDLVLLDTDSRRIFGPQIAALTAADILKKTRLLVYSDSRMRAEAVKDQIVRLLQEQMRGAKIVIAGNHPRSRLLTLMLLDYGADVTVAVDGEMAPHTRGTSFFSLAVYPDVRYVHASLAAEYIEEARAVVVFPEGGSGFGMDLAAHLSAETWLIDAGIGSIDPHGLAIARKRGALPVRVNLWHTLAGVLLTAHHGALNLPTWGEIDSIPVVSGGAFGEEGAVIVDNLSQPAQIIGIADGYGGLLTDTTRYSERIQRISAAIEANQQE